MIGKMYRGLFVRHAEKHIAVASVLKTHHLLPDGRISAGLFPQLARHHDREKHFLPVLGIHLLADYLLYFQAHFLTGHRHRIDAASDLLDKSRADQKHVALYLGVLRDFLHSLANQFAQ